VGYGAGLNAFLGGAHPVKAVIVGGSAFMYSAASRVESSGCQIVCKVAARLCVARLNTKDITYALAGEAVTMNCIDGINGRWDINE